jgi:D-tyrosyl-tRNA(Tyr) deacylase
MRALVQRVSEARVTVAGEVVGAIGPGLCVFVGVAHDDDSGVAHRLATRVAGLRVFDDEDGVMNRSLSETGGAALVVSQFTLYGDTRRGRRPGWSRAAPGPVAEPLVRAFAERLAADGVTVETGRFGAEMSVSLVNEGPVTLMVELDRAPGTSEET